MDDDGGFPSQWKEIRAMNMMIHTISQKFGRKKCTSTDPYLSPSSRNTRGNCPLSFRVPTLASRHGLIQCKRKDVMIDEEKPTTPGPNLKSFFPHTHTHTHTPRHTLLSLKKKREKRRLRTPLPLLPPGKVEVGREKCGATTKVSFSPRISLLPPPHPSFSSLLSSFFFNLCGSRLVMISYL